MTRSRLIELGTYEKKTLKNKYLIKANKNDYVHLNPIGKIIIDEQGKRVAKVIDVIGNINEPYILAYPLTEDEPKTKLYLEITNRESKKRRNRR
ncbi:H/ACA ribonucleoprotein complex subunit GAR1 [Acidianus brierleyi]|uniref:H/ACA RNA-protein complex protein Gar1 n=1 Tax=Acidianus brierleyi TaxID=41673 RepID=A0A2U9IG68_9CREN|nr:Gar1/Naf1 family protein [Acidianus brierleyi]AWR95009.1 H/ACA RNA-protein complex protein Gar1 [Acidianus brierleyi]